MASIFLPPAAILSVASNEIPAVRLTPSLLDVNFPENSKDPMPFAVSPLVIKYETSIKLGDSNFLPKTPSPKINSYRSFSISWQK